MPIKLYTVNNGKTLIIGEYNQETIKLLTYSFDGNILYIRRKYIKDINGNNTLIFCEEADLIDVNNNPIANPQQYISDIWDIAEISYDKYYQHNQNSASNSWSINHNLDKNPSVTVTDSAGTVVHGCIEYIDNNNLTISFVNPFSGKAELN